MSARRTLVSLCAINSQQDAEFQLGDVSDKLSVFAYLSVMLGTITILLLDGTHAHIVDVLLY